MFEHVNGSRDVMKNKFLQIEGQELEIILAQEYTTIYFAKKHRDDLRNAIKGENAQDGADEDPADEDSSS